MIPEHVTTMPTAELEQIVIAQAFGLFDFGVWNGMTVSWYRGLEIIHNCCSIERGVDGQTPVRINIVAGGNGHLGPFLFAWTPEGLDPDRAACTGMPLTSVTVPK